ncbi:MAG: hypothetical protein COV36_07905 [Alphaproteobacteria bacterium CG11_big_fil_rev_8_21_14_0_20_44_7]|nr:MAG: hypothetical protein COV36_07905 [Alphaproteobacteria bacterium CG11_big_fil_rev_8_21_14_0_20_44_7]
MKIFTIVILFAIAACTQIEESHGINVRPASMEKITPVSSKEDVMKLLGSPSTKSSFGTEVWYYISNQQEKRIFSENEILKQNTLAISFDETDQISNIELYDKDDGRVFDFASETTPTAGHDLTVIEQILGNVGRFNPDSMSRNNRR